MISDFSCMNNNVPLPNFFAKLKQTFQFNSIQMFGPTYQNMKDILNWNGGGG